MRETIEQIEERGVELRPIQGLIGYSAGSDGNVYSFWRTGSPRGVKTTARRLIGQPRGRGYLGVILRGIGGAPENHRVHRLVSSAFHGPCPSGMECSHLNGDPSDNRPENLTWETRVENHARKRGHGTLLTGARHPRPTSVLTPSDIKDIRALYSEGVMQKELAENYGVTRSAISAVIVGRTWGHV